MNKEPGRKVFQAFPNHIPLWPFLTPDLCEFPFHHVSDESFYCFARQNTASPKIWMSYSWGKMESSQEKKMT